MEHKQLVILIFHLNGPGRNINSYHEKLRETFNENVQVETNTVIKIIIVPTYDTSKTENIHVECLFPKEEDLPEEIMAKINKLVDDKAS